jgi:hypothetical protein
LHTRRFLIDFSEILRWVLFDNSGRIFWLLDLNNKNYILRDGHDIEEYPERDKTGLLI